MTTDDIIRMAREAGLAFDSEEYPDIWQTYMYVGREEIERFAALVAAHGREAAMKDAERYRHAMREAMYLLDQPEPRPHAAFSELLLALNPNLASAKICWEHGTVDCAAAIRERGKNAHR